MLLAAVAENGVIGRDNALPWRLSIRPQAVQGAHARQAGGDGPQDLSLDRQAAARTAPTSWSRATANFRAEGVLVANSVEAALDMRARRCAPPRRERDHGDRRHRDFRADHGALPTGWRSPTFMRSPEGDTYFPAIDPTLWRETARSEQPAGPRDDASVQLCHIRARLIADSGKDQSGQRCWAASVALVVRRIRLPYNRPQQEADRRQEAGHQGEISMPWSNQGGGPWGSGGSKGPWGSGPQSSGPTPPDLEELLRRSQDKLKNVLPGGNLGGRGFALLALGAIVLWGVSGFFRVEPDELGVVLRFGKHVREVQPGLNYHLPYPIETVLTPKALRVNKIDVGMRMVDDSRRGTTVRDVPEESLMLTGDENIVDVDFSVLWKVKPAGVGDYLFNIQNPEGTVKAVAESAMREVVGRSNIQPILTGARQNIETAVQDLMQKTLDQLRRRHPDPAGADCRRSIRRRRSSTRSATCRRRAPTSSARRTRRRPTPTAWCRRRAAARRKSLQNAEAYREQTVAEAHGQTSRFLKIYDEYKKAPDVTRQRMYLETMERLFGGTDKIILDSGGSGSGSGVVPYPAAQRTARGAAPREREAPDEARYRQAASLVVVLIVAAILGYQLAVHGLPDAAGAGGPARPAGARASPSPA